MIMPELTESMILTAIATDAATASTELTQALIEMTQYMPVVIVPNLPGQADPVEIVEHEFAISAYNAIRWMITKGLVTKGPLLATLLIELGANPHAPPTPPAHTINDLDDYYINVVNGGSVILNSGDITAAFLGVPSTPIYGSGNPPATGDAFSTVSGNLTQPVKDIPGMCGLTSYNRVEGHFYLKHLPEPKLESVRRTVQGVSDRFESQYEDPHIKSVVSNNEKVRLTEQVFSGEPLTIETKTQLATYTASGVVKHAFVVQGGDSFTDTTYGNVVSSTQDSIVAIALEDIRPFLLKGLDDEENALFDLVNPTKPTNENYVRHLAPEAESRVAVLETPTALQNAGGPSKILIHYNAIDLTGEVVAGWKSSSYFTASDHAHTYRNDMDAILTMESKGWLVVEKTVPDTNTVFVDTSHGYPVYRTVLDWLRRPYNANQFSSPPTYTPLTIHSPGGIITIPSKDFQGELIDNSLRSNPTGDLSISPFINLDNCAHTVIQQTIAGNRIRNDPYGPPVAIPHTRSPIQKNDSVYHTLTITSQTKEDLRSSYSQSPSLTPVNFEQFDIIDNLVKGDRHTILIQPSNRMRTKTLETIKTRQDGLSRHHNCSIELTLMRGRIEEVNPLSGDDNASGVSLRGRSQLLDITDRLAERDFSLNEGFGVKEIGDLGSPAVSMTLGGLGQGGIDVAPTRTEHSKLPIWKDKVIGTNNPSVRNDKQTSTYYASTRALVELPLFPSMFYDINNWLPTSVEKRSPLPTEKCMEMVIDCTMTAINRPQMQHYENRWAIDWGMRGSVSSMKIHDYKPVAGQTIIRFMRENAASFLKLGTYSGGETIAASGTSASDSYIEVDSVYPFVEEGGINSFASISNKNATGITINTLLGEPAGSTTLVVTSDARLYFKAGDKIYAGNSGAFVGTVASVTSTNINLTSGSLVSLNNGEDISTPYWNLGSASATPNGDNGFAVTVGEGVINDTGGIRLRIYKASIHGLSHRLYFDTFHDWGNQAATLTEVKNQMIIGLPVVMGCWLSDNDSSFNGTVQPLVGFSATAGTSNSTMAQNFINPMKNALCLGNTPSNRTSICIDPSDSSRILINGGVSMEGFSFDPGNHLYGADDMPLLPPVECRTGHFALKGKRNDNTLDYVRPLHINLGSVANSNNVSNFREAVNEVIRKINQAGHPDAKNSNGGSAFNPPQLFTEADGTETVSSLDTGTHMGYVRAFLGENVESRDGERGISIVIHSTIPGATGRNFAVWLHNRGIYPYRPIQTIGHGGLLATNSRSYQASSFPAPLPLGMDGETHIPITTFQGGVHGSLQNAKGDLRTYNGIGSEFILKGIKNAKTNAGNNFPAYDIVSFPHIAVERNALDLIKRYSQHTDSSSVGYILVDDKLVGTFENIVGAIGGTNAKREGVGSCAFLTNAQPVDDGLIKKWSESFVDRNGEAKDSVIRILYPLPDAHGILFFGGGHTGTVFDISDGTNNDYSDFYTHHYSQGPTGYGGFQNLHEVQTSAAVLDFTNLKNTDTVKENTYQGIHTKHGVVQSGQMPDDSHYIENECVFYARLNEDALFATNHGTNGVEQKIDTLFGVKGVLYGNYSANALGGPITADGDSKGMDWATANNMAMSLHHVGEGTGTSPQMRVALTDPTRIVGSDPQGYSVSFFVSAKPNIGPWTSEAYANGPVLHAITDNNATLGVSLLTKEGSDPAMMEMIVVVRCPQSIGSQFDYYCPAFEVEKDAWTHIVVSWTTGPNAQIYVDGVFQAYAGGTSSAAELRQMGDSSYEAGSIANTPHLAPTMGIPRLVSSGVLVNKTGGYTAGETDTIVVDTVTARSQFSIGDEVFNASDQILGVIKTLNDTGITFTTKLINAVGNNGNLKKASALASTWYGRTSNMLAIGTAINSLTPTSTYYYGRHYGGASNAYDPICFKGALAEVALWNKVLSQAEVTELFDAQGVWN